MSVYTLLALSDVQDFLPRYALPPAQRLDPIKGGIENSNYFLTLTDGRELVLTLFEELSADNAAFLGPLLSHLSAAGVPVAAPLPDRHGAFLNTLAGKPAQLAPRLRGDHPDTPDAAACATMGAALAQLHLALQDYALSRPNAHGPEWWNEVAARWLPKLPEAERALMQNVLRHYENVCRAHAELPRGLIHGDLFRDNTLFDAGRVSAILDFSETSRDHWLLDIAITENDFCRAWRGAAPEAGRSDAFLAGYDSVRPLAAAEKSALPVFRAVAALRFWLSRLDTGARNASEGRGGEHVLEKDPAEMRDLCAALLAAL